MEIIQDVFGATTVGVVALVILAFLIELVYSTKPGVTGGSAPGGSARVLNWQRFAQLNAVHVSILAPVVFGCGLIVQDLTDNLTDSEYGDNMVRAILGSEGEHRINALFRDEGLSEPSSLWTHVMAEREDAEGLLDRSYPDQRSEIREFMRSPSEFVSGDEPNAGSEHRDKVQRYVNTLYYNAKNWTYLQTTYFSELEKVQRRIDFARSAFLVLFWGLIATILVFAATCYWVSGKMRVATAVVMVVLVIGCRLTGQGYQHAERNFNERVFGYYYTHLHRLSLWNQPAGAVSIASTEQIEFQIVGRPAVVGYGEN